MTWKYIVFCVQCIYFKILIDTTTIGGIPIWLGVWRIEEIFSLSYWEFRFFFFFGEGKAYQITIKVIAMER